MLMFLTSVLVCHGGVSVCDSVDTCYWSVQNGILPTAIGLPKTLPDTHCLAIIRKPVTAMYEAYRCKCQHNARSNKETLQLIKIVVLLELLT